MANPQRGEVDLITDEGARIMRLTLGALAELEAELGANGLVGIAERFEGGAFTSRDLIALLTAGLRGGGVEVTQSEVEQLSFKGGAAGAAAAAAALLALTFKGAA